MKSSNVVVIGSAVLLAMVGPRANAQTFAERIVGGLNGPMFGTHVPGDPSRLFLGRIWSGRIEVVDLTTRTVLPEPFLVIDDLPNPLFNEQGLLGLAFDPDYATNGYFFVNYTAPDDSITIRRYRVLGDPATSNVADPASGLTLLRVPKQEWHNGGWIAFGPNDGYLYITIGDTGGGHGQITSGSLLGKVLRIDVDGDGFPADPLRNYAIPPTNPFVGVEGDDEIWAYGLRNPWQASFDRQTGDLWINDVGENSREEVNYQPADIRGGENYGWPRREGTISGPPPHGGPPSSEYTDPVYDYARDEPNPLFAGATVGASALYRGPVAAFHGHYLFTDVASSNIWKLDPDAVDRRASVVNVNDRLQPDIGLHQSIPAFGEDAVGNVYLMDFASGTDGEIFLIATESKDIVWNGNDASAGVAGDGLSWGDANNWTRDGEPDESFVAEDQVIFAAGSSGNVIDLELDRVASAVTFSAPYTLANHTLRVLSGNVTVELGVTAVVEADLLAESAHHSIRKLGTGTLVVEGDSGQTVVKAGTLVGTGTLDHLTVRDGGVVGPGNSVGTLSVENSFTMDAGATLSIEIGGADNSNPAAPQFDQLVVGGTATLAGILQVELVDLGAGVFSPGLDDSFPIVMAGGLSGSFTLLSLPALPTGLVWQHSSDGEVFVLNVVTRLRGDFNGDFRVDAADYTVWRETQGDTGSSLAADASGPGGVADGVVDEFDRIAWMANFGAVGGAFGAAVPESNSVRLAAIASGILLVRRRW
jgi:hypothetical protein